MRGRLRVGACQTPEILGDIESALVCIEDFARQADHRADLLVFPECFLQGYLVDEEHVRRHALDLHSASFASLLRRLERIEQTLVFGVIEQQGGRYFNAAVIIARGALVGAYRKTHLLPANRCSMKATRTPPSSRGALGSASTSATTPSSPRLPRRWRRRVRNCCSFRHRT